MEENTDESNFEGISTEKCSSETINATEKEMLKQLIEKQIEQDKINKEIIENQQKLMEKLQSIEDKQDGKKQKQEESDSENTSKRADLDTSAVDKSGQEEHVADISGTATKFLNQKDEKCFTLKHTFKDVSKLENEVSVFSEEQDHFGIHWRMYIYHYSGFLAFYTQCQNKTAKGLWSIKTDCEVKLLSKNRKPDIRKCCAIYKQDESEEIRHRLEWGWDQYLMWDDVWPNFLIDDSLTFVVSFKIKNTTGIYKNLRSFDDPECSDVVLTVQDKKFYVSKIFLATQSSYFKVMFLGMFGDAKKSEIPLTGIDADDFQKYLEVLYGENAIDEYTVEGILMVSDMYDTQIVIKKCEEFLLEKSKNTLKKKLELSAKYRLERLKKDCLSKIHTVDHIRDLFSESVRDLDPSIMADFLEKALDSN